MRRPGSRRAMPGGQATRCCASPRKDPACARRHRCRARCSAWRKGHSPRSSHAGWGSRRRALPHEARPARGRAGPAARGARPAPPWGSAGRARRRACRCASGFGPTPNAARSRTAGRSRGRGTRGPCAGSRRCPTHTPWARPAPRGRARPGCPRPARLRERPRERSSGRRSR